jgi:hypothetical protein
MAFISEEEKLRRRDSNESVFGSFAMEGLEPDEATRAIFAQYAEGDLSLEEFSAAMDRHAQTLLASLGKLVGAA